MAEPLIIVGAGGFGREVACLAAGPWNLLGFLDDDPRLQGTVIVGGLRVLGPLSDGVKFKDAQFILAVGSPRTRQAIAGALDRLGDVRYATLVHPSAGRFDRSSIGEGSIVGWHALLSDKTAVGRHCILNAVTTIGHDSVLGDFCTLASHVSICGNVSIGNGAEVGTGAVVLPGVSLGRGSLCCAGSIVANDVADSAAVAGNPARRFKDLSPFPV